MSEVQVKGGKGTKSKEAKAMAKVKKRITTVNTDEQALAQFRKSGLDMDKTSKRRGKKSGGLPGFKMPKTGLPTL